MKKLKKQSVSVRLGLVCLAVVLAASLVPAGQLSKVLCVNMCGSTGSGGACHPGQQTSGKTMMNELATKYNFTVTHTTTAAEFTDAGLAPFDCIVLNNVGNNPFSASQQAAFIKYLYNGGGFIGWHASAASHYQWPWYTDSFMCGDINGHGGVDPWPILLDSINKDHPVLTGMFSTIGPERALVDTVMADEWYYWKPDPVTNSKVKILVWVKQNGVKRAMSWCKEFCTASGLPPGRQVYSNCGQSNTVGGNNYYTNSWFKQFVINGLRWAAHLPSSTDQKYLASVCPTGVGPVGKSGSQIRKTSLQELFSDVKAGKAFVEVYSVNGQKIHLKSFASFKDLKNALPPGCAIVRISDASGRILNQTALAQ
jgi:type 1 glutamine amidotransferase